MKKIIIASILILSYISCTNEIGDIPNELNTPNKIEYNDEQTGRKYIYELISLTMYNEELSEVVSKYDIDNNTSTTILLEVINELSQQDCFGDTLGETDSWFFFLEWYYSK